MLGHITDIEIDAVLRPDSIEPKNADVDEVEIALADFRLAVAEARAELPQLRSALADLRVVVGLTNGYGGNA